MKPEYQTDLQKQAERRVALVLFGLLQGISGAIVLCLFAWLAGPSIEETTGFPVQWWHGLLAGLTLGLATTFFQLLSFSRRQDAMTQQSEPLGLDPLSQEDAERLGNDLQKLFVDRVNLFNTFFHTINGSSLVISDLRLDEPATGTSDSPSQERTQTCAILELESFQFPEFRLAPKKTFLIRLLNLMGRKDIAFDDSPTFTGQYQLVGSDTESIRKLYSPTVRAFFERHPGWTVTAGGKIVVLFRSRQMVKPDQLNEFVTLAMATLDELQKAGSAFLPKPVHQPITRTGLMSEASQYSGPVAAMLNRQIDRQSADLSSINRVLYQAVPRKLSPDLLRIFRADWFLLMWGGFFLFGGCFISLFALTGAASPNETPVIITIAGALFLLGSGVVLPVKFFEWRRLRILRTGTVVNGTIERVIQTIWVAGSSRIHELTVRIPVSDTSRTMRVLVPGIVAENAKRQAESGKPIRLLQDNKNRHRLIALDCYAIGD